MVTDTHKEIETRVWLRALTAADLWIARLDGTILVASLLGSAFFASVSFVLRNVGAESSPWLDILPRYFTMAVGFFGAALATQRGSHIALDILNRFLPDHVARWTKVIANLVACGVATMLALASWEFIEFEREGASAILGLIPSWWPALMLLWGFGISAVRFLLRAVSLFPAALLVAPGMLWFLDFFTAQDPQVSFWVIIVGLVIGAALGMPLFAILGGLALTFFWNDGTELAVVPIEIFRLVESPTLVTLPLFTLMGAVLAKGGAPGRLVRVARALLGWAPGGLAVASVVVCAFFTTFTGASGVTILALGLLLHTMLTQEGYSDRLSIGLITSSGSIGLLFAPALPLIIYGIVAKVDIDRMFVAGLLPGLVLISTVAFAAVMLARKQALDRHRFDWGEAVASIKGAALELLLPVIVLGSLLLGLATVVEAAAIGAVYTLAVVLFFHKDVKLGREIFDVVEDSGVLIGAVLIILGVALGFTGFLVDAQVPQAVVEIAQENLSSRWTFLLAVNVLLLIVGCLLDIFSAIIIFVPLLAPVATAFGVDPVHLGIIFLANLEIGYITPPVGMNLFLSSFRFDRPLPQIYQTALPFLVVMLIALLIITYVPALSLAFLGD